MGARFGRLSCHPGPSRAPASQPPSRLPNLPPPDLISLLLFPSEEYEAQISHGWYEDQMRQSWSFQAFFGFKIHCLFFIIFIFWNIYQSTTGSWLNPLRGCSGDTIGFLRVRKVRKNKDPTCVPLQWTFPKASENFLMMGVPDPNRALTAQGGHSVMAS